MTKRIILNKRHIRRLRLYRLYGIDLFKFFWKKISNPWNLVHRIYSNITNPKNYFRGTLRVDMLEKPFRKRLDTMYMKTFINKKLFYTYYHNITYYALRSLAVKAKKKKRFVVCYFLLYLEQRIDTILYRVGWFTSVYMIRQKIMHGNIIVNKRLVTNYSHRICFYDILTVSRKIKPQIYNFIKSRINLFKKKINIFEVNTPHYLEVSYRTLSVTILPKTYILPKFIYFPAKINVEQMMHVYRKSQK